jgi:predicted RecB family nuclease
MKRNPDNTIQFSATDLSNFISCQHLTQLNKQKAQGSLEPPPFMDPYADTVRQLGLEHEERYVQYLRDQGLDVTDLRDHSTDENGAGETERGSSVERTLKAMQQGAEIIVQAKFDNGKWLGYADILRKVKKPCNLGDWSYEVGDSKLSQETKAGTVLQLCVYSDMLTEVQGVKPDKMLVIKPGGEAHPEEFLYDSYAAYYRFIKRQMLAAVTSEKTRTYPDPVAHCSVCQWWVLCEKQRRDDDHLSYVAGMQGGHVTELNTRGVDTLAQFASRDKALDSRPSKGNLETYARLHRQAKIQFEGRETGELLHQILDTAATEGFSKLPVPSEGDVFYDIESDRFYKDGGIEYLHGVAFVENGEMQYKAWWAFNRADEKKAFEELMDFFMDSWQKYPDFNIYHFAPYEPAALKRLMLRHSTRKDELDRFLRAERFIDLHAIVKHSLIASIEGYGLKELEPLFNFKRQIDLKQAGVALHMIQRSLEIGSAEDIQDTDKEAVRIYNADDCYATHALQIWLEKLRSTFEAANGPVPRAPLKEGEATEEVDKRNENIARIFDGLVEGLPVDAIDFNNDEKATWLLAHLLEYFRREEKTFWWDYYARRDMEYEDLLEDRKAITGLQYKEEVPQEGRKKIPIHRYTFPRQELSISDRDNLHNLNNNPELEESSDFGTVIKIDTIKGIVDIKKTRKSIDIHPHSAQEFRRFPHQIIEASLLRFAEDVLNEGVHSNKRYRAGRDLLLKLKPRISGHTGKICKEDEDTMDAAIRSALHLDKSVLPIQGPPGTGKTYTGAHMILALTRQGKRVGVTAVSHKAIENLLKRIQEEARLSGQKIGLAHKSGRDSTAMPDGITRLVTGNDVIAAIGDHVVGGTAFLWASDDAINSLDYLFIDEAGQMSLAYVLAISQCATNLVMLGDPQQLEQPQQGAHPEGADVSALSHYLDGKQTIADEKGLFLGTTWRLHPRICDFTSEQYYEGRLDPRDGMERQALAGEHRFVGAGLFYIPVEHKGNRNQSDEEIEAIKDVLAELLQPGSTWTHADEGAKPLTARDIKIIAPYNAQVAALQQAFPNIRVGTVDKFQGQEAPVIIYSMASSSTEESPRGMSFLFDPHRLNVASSRARCAFIMVASPRLFEAECHSPKQMGWANGMCRVFELSKTN